MLIMPLLDRYCARTSASGYLCRFDTWPALGRSYAV